MTDFYDYNTLDELDALEHADAHDHRDHHRDHHRPQLLLFNPYPQGDGLPALLKSLLPQAYITADDPVFAYELRGVDARYDRRSLWRRGGRAALNGVGAAVMIWAGVLLLIAVLSTAGNTPPEPDFRYTLTWITVGVFGMAALGIGYVLDGLMTFSVAFSSADDDPVQRDLLRLSNLDTEALVRARYAAVQVKAWTALWTGVGWRLGFLLFALLNLTLTPLLIPGLDAGVYFRETARLDLPPLVQGTLIMGGVVFAGLWLVEPVWRMRALVAAGLEAGAAGRAASSMTLYCAGALVGVWLIQMALAVVALIWTFVATASFLCAVASPFALAFVIGGGLRMLYGGVQVYWLTRAYNRLHGDFDG